MNITHENPSIWMPGWAVMLGENVKGAKHIHDDKKQLLTVSSGKYNTNGEEFVIYRTGFQC